MYLPLHEVLFNVFPLHEAHHHHSQSSFLSFGIRSSDEMLCTKLRREILDLSRSNFLLERDLESIEEKIKLIIKNQQKMELTFNPGRRKVCSPHLLPRSFFFLFMHPITLCRG